MTRHDLARVALATLTVLGTACASTTLNVEPAPPKSTVQGIRYSLPKPFLIVKPSPSGDGTFSVEVIYLPNESQTYAISARTKRGKYSLDVETKDGLLKKISWGSEGSAAAGAAAAETAAALAKTMLERRDTEAAAAETQAETALEALQTDEKTARALVATKELAVKLAEIELESAKTAAAIPGKPTPAEREVERQARLARDKAAAELAAAEADLKTRQTQLSTALSGGAKNDAEQKAARTTSAHFWGPVIYEIRDTGATVDLVPVKWTTTATQVEFETVTVKAPLESDGATAGPTANQLSLKGQPTRSGAGVVIRFDALTAVKSIDTNQLGVFDTAIVPTAAPTATIESAGKVVVLTFPSLAKGTYRLVFGGTNADGSQFPVDIAKIEVP